MSVSVLSRETQPEHESAVHPQPVHQWQVHKLCAEEILLTTWAERSPECFVLTANWPRQHDFYRPSQGAYDPLLLAESVRQAVPLLSHAVHGVPREHQQAWEDFSFSFEPLASLVTTADEEVRLTVACSDVVRRGARFAGMVMDVEVHQGERLLGTARTRFNNQPAAVYRRLRGPYADKAAALALRLPPGPPVEPRRVDRDSRHDVVLSPAPGGGRGRWLLRSDPAHPVLFDHAVDHAPGMLLLEAARQAAHAAFDSPHAVVGMRTRFIRYVEFDAPALVLVGEPVPDGPGRHRVAVSVEQHGASAFTSEVTVETALGL
ncbi:ScbA/BarX family gamma-butyrolactone biosynthesis protein [Streptomyces sp. NPDC087440]|uniref:ScbA/BarX family gamma-butyrolactone biosynthesis protein n=1 Tax=Streptomyces sp. NPDC087440 TaxID=3365790 RepID=UPI0038286855